jgi:transcriptional regulator with XRE-family HTH domain
MNNFCETLKERRKSVGLSQRKLAERAGIDIETVRHIERGKTKKPYEFTVNAINAVIEEERQNKLRVLTGTQK